MRFRKSEKPWYPNAEQLRRFHDANDEITSTLTVNPKYKYLSFFIEDHPELERHRIQFYL